MHMQKLHKVAEYLMLHEIMDGEVFEQFMNEETGNTEKAKEEQQ